MIRFAPPSLPSLCGSIRRAEDPEDLSDLIPKRVKGPYPAVESVVNAQGDAQHDIPHTCTVILRDIETHPKNVHYNTAGQMKIGERFAQSFLQPKPKLGDHSH